MALPIIDIVLTPIAYLYVFLIIYLATMFKQKGIVSGEMARKIVHIGIGVMVILAPLLFKSRLIPTIIGCSFIIVTFFTSPISPVISFRLSAFRDGHGMGTVYYSFSLTILLYLFWDYSWIIQAGFLPLVFGDAFAHIIGRRYGKRHWYLITDKTIEGTLAAFLASFISVFLALSLYLGLDLFAASFLLILVISTLEGIAMALVELISPYGLDNISIPLVCTLIAVVVAPIPLELTLFLS